MAAAAVIPKVVEGIKLIKGTFEQKKFNAALAKVMVGRLDFINQTLDILLKAGIEDHIVITNVGVTIQEAQE